MTLGPYLTEDQVGELPNGTEVEITWSGGNGPHRYRIEQSVYGTFWRYDGLSDEQWKNVKLHQDVISFVGSERYHTRVQTIKA